MLAQVIPRTIKMIVKPQEYWEEMIAEPGDIKSLLPTMLILAAIPAVATLLGVGLLGGMRQGFLGLGIFGRYFAAMLFAVVLQYGMSIGSWIILGYLIDAFAPTFGGQKDIGQSMKLATIIIPTWLGQVLAITTFQGLAWVGMLGGLGYGGYILYVGLPLMNGTSQEKAPAYAAAALGCLLGVMLLMWSIMCIPTACCMASAFIR